MTLNLPGISKTSMCGVSKRCSLAVVCILISGPGQGVCGEWILCCVYFDKIGIWSDMSLGFVYVSCWDSVNTLPASEFDPAAYTQGPRFITTGAESDVLLIREQGPPMLLPSQWTTTAVRII
jgi:hypothetical protein